MVHLGPYNLKQPDQSADGIAIIPEMMLAKAYPKQAWGELKW